MKIIVTGGAGFIASHIADEYIKAGHRVAIIDDLSKGFRKNINKKAKFYKADITNLALMEKIFAKEKPEAVNHHAAIADATGFKEKPIYAPYRAGEIYRISLDARHARKVLGWKPKMKFKEGVREAVKKLRASK